MEIILAIAGFLSKWQILFDNFATALENPKKVPFSTKIILGASIEKQNKEMLLNLGRRKGLPIYQAYLLPNKYEISMYPVV